jgi:peptidoglycan/xylan/chitin deacetylase (PgdA/CDA1 family)
MHNRPAWKRGSPWITGWLWLLAAILAGCSPMVAVGAEPSPSPTVTLTPSPTDTVISPPSATPLPTHTPTLTSTPVPTETTTPPPNPTASPTPTTTSTPALEPTPDAEAPSRQVRLPILMYHYVEPWPEGADELRQRLTVRPEDFAAQMAYLHAQGYACLSLYDLIEALASGRQLPDRAVVLTFDDGYRGLYDHARPVMQQYGFAGTVFVITQLMDEGFPQYLTWEQAEALYAQGWKIEPHTKTHHNLKGRGRDFQLYQMLGSMLTVEAHIGTTPRFFAYPSGQHDELSVQLAEELHLWGAVTTEYGRWHTHGQRFTTRRVRVAGTNTLADFVALLEGDQLP